MKMVKGLTKANAAKYGIEVREDLDFTDDGNRFRGFSYKGIPMTQCRAEGTCYLVIRTDYMNNTFTYNEWRETEEFALEDEFNGVEEFDIDKLIENLEAVKARVDEMNAAAESEELNLVPLKAHQKAEVNYAKQIIENFKKYFKWYEADSYKLKILCDYMKSLQKKIDAVEALVIDDLTKANQKWYLEQLNMHGYAFISQTNFYIERLQQALA